MNTISQNLTEIRARMDAAASRAGRNPADVRLVAVTKTHPVELIREAIAAGVTEVGENRVQEAVPKIDEIGRSALRYHLIGHLQSNKAKVAARYFDMVHSVDSEKLAAELDRYRAGEATPLDVLLQVNVSREESKSGLHPSEAAALLAYVNEKCPNLRCRGFMTMAPLLDDPEGARPHFAALRELADSIWPSGLGSYELSMGMTGDFEVAIEEGATLVRIGSAIFGSR